MPSLLSCCAPLAEEARLLSDCYPPKKQLPSSTSFNPALPSAGIDTVKPLSQELSRLTYYAANKPGKLRAIGEELDVRVAKHTRAAKGGNGKERVMLLISLSILRSLISECRRELSLFASSIVKCIDLSLSYALSPNLSGASGTSSTVGVDLELAVAAGTAFTPFATYATASTFGADDAALDTYLSVLDKFAAMATFIPKNGAPKTVPQSESNGRDNEKSIMSDDFEIRNRTRLIGLAALMVAVQSDLLNASHSDFGKQSNLFIPALITNLWLGDLDDLKMETAKAQIDTSPSPYFTEFQARPRLSERKAPSLHAHIVGEKGPATSDVVGGALRTLRELVESCHSTQLNICLRTMIDFLDGNLSASDRRSGGSSISGWNDRERCCWLAESIASYAMLGYRYNVPVTLLDQLVFDTKDTATLTDREFTLTEMLISLFSAEKLSLVGIAPAELLTSLLDIVVARVRIQPKDALLPRLVQCIFAIGSHVYYTDQTNDMIEVVISRIADVQASATTTKTELAAATTNPTPESWHQEVIRVMVACMINLMLASQPTSGTALPPAPRGEVSDHLSLAPSKGKGPSNSRINTPDLNSGIAIVQGRSSRRNPVSPEIWQDTLPLLCESTYPVRAEYARALILYLRKEFPASVRILANGTEPDHGIHLKQARLGAIRFLHALNATLYTLAISNRLGYAGPAKMSMPTIGPIIQETSPSPLYDSPRATTPETTKTVGTPSRAVPTPQPRDSNSGTPTRPGPPAPLVTRRSSKLVSLPIHRMHHQAFGETIAEYPSTDVEPGTGIVATAFDYLAISVILNTSLRVLPVEGISTIVPMLLAMDRDAGQILVRQPGEEDGPFLAERRRACKEIVCLAWKEIAHHYSMHELSNTIEQIQASLPSPSILPPGPFVEAREGLSLPEDPVQFPALGIRGEASSSLRPILDPVYATNQLANNHQFRSEMKLSSEDVVRVLSKPWSVDESLSNSIEGQPYDVSRRSSPRRAKLALAELARPGSALSLQSYGQNGQRGIDVSDLRDALGMTRTASATKLASAAPSIQTNGTRHTTDEPAGLSMSTSTRRLRPDDAREILKDILREKKPASHAVAKAPS